MANQQIASRDADTLTKNTRSKTNFILLLLFNFPLPFSASAYLLVSAKCVCIVAKAIVGSKLYFTRQKEKKRPRCAPKCV